MTTRQGAELSRRGLLPAAGGLAAAATADVAVAQTTSQPAPATSASGSASGRRKFGTLEVSNIGLGVQNMSRTYQQTILTRAEMHNIIRSAFDSGLTFYDALGRQRKWLPLVLCSVYPGNLEFVAGDGIKATPACDKAIVC